MATTSKLHSTSDIGTRRSYWRDRSEEELLSTDFTTDEPEKLPGMTEAKPADDEEPFVEMTYALKGREAGMARCVHCGYENHYNGFVLRYPDGQRRLVGKDCGKRLYGADFHLFEADFNAAKDFAAYIRRRRAAVAASPRLIEGLQRFCESPAVATFTETRKRFRETLPGLYAQLAIVAATTQSLSITEKVRNRDEEERRETALERMTQSERQKSGYLNRKGKLAPVWRDIPKPLGILSGTKFFLVDDNPSTVLPRIRADIEAVFERLEDENLSSKQMATTLIKLGDLLADVEREHARLRSLFDAFEAGNLARIAEWANYTSASRGGDRYQAEIGSIRCLTDSGTKECRFPEDYKLPSRQFVAVFRLQSDPTRQEGG